MPGSALVSPEAVDSPIVLSIDIGSSSVRTALYDVLGRQVVGTLARRKIELLTGADGMAVLEADPLLELLWACIDETLAHPVTKRLKIFGVGCCTFVSNILGADRQGRPLTPVFTYADTRPVEDVATLNSQFDAQAVFQRTGCVFHPSYMPARFVWMKRVAPALFAAVDTWMTVGEYLILKLFGDAAVSYSAASWSGLLDRSALDWDEELLAGLSLERNQLSPLVDVHHYWSGLQQTFAVRWPMLREVPWFPAIGDGAAANLGCGCVSPERVALTVGSSSAMRVTIPGVLPAVPTGLWCYRVDRGTVLLGGALSEGGNILGWLRNSIQVDIPQDLEDVLAHVHYGTHGLTFLPLLAGERSPGWRGEARGAITGLSLATTPIDILVAALEGVALRIGLVYELLKAELPAGHTVIANGGALVGIPAWVQIMADVLGCPVILSSVEEASARGSALLALRSLGLVARLNEFPPFYGREFVPDPVRHRLYLQAKERQQRLYGLS